MKKGKALSEAYRIVFNLISQHLQVETEIPAEVEQELNALKENSLAYSDRVKDREYTDDYPIYDGDDVKMCPRCHDQDLTPGHRVCSGCESEMYADIHG